MVISRRKFAQHHKLEDDLMRCRRDLRHHHRYGIRDAAKLLSLGERISEIKIKLVEAGVYEESQFPSWKQLDFEYANKLMQKFPETVPYLQGKIAEHRVYR